MRNIMEISEILDMLDWHMPPETQAEGVALAAELGVVEPFLQPLTQEHNKNVWDNCAKIIAGKRDGELEAHLPGLLEWLQDMNWPGAFLILERLKEYADTDTLHTAADACIQQARSSGDPVWEENIRSAMLLRQRGRTAMREYGKLSPPEWYVGGWFVGR